MKRRKFFTQVLLRVCILCVVIFLSSQLVTQTKASFMDQEQRSMEITTAPIFPGTAEGYTAEVEQAFHSASETYAKLTDLSLNEDSLKGIEKALDEAVEKRSVFQDQTERYYTVHNEAMEFFQEYDFEKYSFLLHELNKVKEVNKKFEELSSKKMDEAVEHLRARKEDWMKEEKETASEEDDENKNQEGNANSEEKEAEDQSDKVEEMVDISSEGTDDSEETKESENLEEESSDSVNSTSEKSKDAASAVDTTEEKKEQPEDKDGEEETTQQTDSGLQDSEEHSDDEVLEKQSDDKGVSTNENETEHETLGGQDDEEDL
ncbi:hypothetical protein ACQ4XT_17580 [Halobacillus faecis]